MALRLLFAAARARSCRSGERSFTCCGARISHQRWRRRICAAAAAAGECEDASGVVLVIASVAFQHAHVTQDLLFVI